MRSRKTNSDQRCDRNQGTYRRDFVLAASVIVLVAGLLAACDMSDFGDMNQNPTQMTGDDIIPEPLFSNIQLAFAGGRNELQTQNWRISAEYIQHISQRGNSEGAYYAPNRVNQPRFWETHYSGGWRATIKQTVDLLAHLEGRQADGELVDNKLAATRIMWVFTAHRITDMYGDMPYFEGGRGFHDLNFNPSYDRQEDIYEDMLKELDEAVEQFDRDQPTYGAADLVYGGDIDHWLRFGNSLRLRLALRLVKVDPQWAMQEAQAAINARGGLMTSNDDIWLFEHEEGPGFLVHTNGNAEMYAIDEPDDMFLSQTMVNWLLEHDDPRLRVYGAVVKDGEVNMDPAVQLGRPNGYSSAELRDHPSWTGDENDYTRLHPRFKDMTHPSIWFTYAEVEFMLAEAAVRGWIGSDPESHHNEGVRAAMDYLSNYTGDGVDISEAEINDYLQRNPYNSGGTPDQQLEQINTQYWAATFMNGMEAWVNWVRSGYPDIESTPVDQDEPHPLNETDGEIPRRALYPPDEELHNRAKFEEVLNRQGPNEVTTRVWWDVGN